jgi:Helix-loop-helix DNA-binding domain
MISCNDLSVVQTAKYSKLEKADILEMTVDYMKAVRLHQLRGKNVLAILCQKSVPYFYNCSGKLLGKERKNQTIRR